MAAHASASRPVTFERERGVYRVELQTGLAHASVFVGDGPDRIERIQRALSTLADQGIPIFLIKLHGRSVTFGVEEPRLGDVEKCLGSAADFRARRGLALVSVLAPSMSDLTGVMVRIADSLRRVSANLIGVGDSHNSVQLLIDGARAEEAVAELEATFDLRSRDA